MAHHDLKRIHKFVEPYRITRGHKFRLKDMDPGDTRGLKSESKGRAREALANGVEWLADEQERSDGALDDGVRDAGCHGRPAGRPAASTVRAPRRRAGS